MFVGFLYTDVSSLFPHLVKSVFQSKKISQVLSPKEKKPPIVNNQCVVYKCQCDLCDTDNVGYTTFRNWKTLGRPWPIEVRFEGDMSRI